MLLREEDIQELREKAAFEERQRWVKVLEEQSEQEKALSEGLSDSPYQAWRTLGVVRRGHANACTQIAKAMRNNDPSILE